MPCKLEEIYVRNTESIKTGQTENTVEQPRFKTVRMPSMR